MVENLGVTPEVEKLLEEWCRWCVAHKAVVPFNEWVHYTHMGETVKIIMKAFRSLP